MKIINIENMSRIYLLKFIFKVTMITAMVIGSAYSGHAQLNPLHGMYFQNRYQYNPAMAGIEKGLNINLAYRQQWSTFPGMPKTASFTADFQPTDRVGLGINVNDDQAGLIRATRIMGTYAYHLPLSDKGDRLNFGLSLGVNDSRVNYNNLDGDINDAEVAQYNNLKPYVDGDFGIAYTSNRLYIGAAIPNLKSAFFKSSDGRFDADRLLYIGIASYKIPIMGDNQGFILEPMAGFRIVKGYKDIMDLGMNFTMKNYGIYFQGIYHTSQSMDFGFGLNQKNYSLNLSYNIETGTLKRYTKGAFEFGLALRLFKK